MSINMFISTLARTVFSALILNLLHLSVVEAHPTTADTLHVQDVSAPNTGASGLTHCQGDCYDDSECAPGLICYQRTSASQGVPPGCHGNGKNVFSAGSWREIWDYCYDPNYDGEGSIPSSEPSSNPSTDPSSIPSLEPTLNKFSWDILLDTPGYLKEPPIESGVHKFITIYNISDRYYEFEVFKADCLTPSSGLPLLYTSDSKVDGDNSIEAVFLYNQSIIQQSNLWTTNATGGNVDLCLKISLYTNSSNGILFNFKETVYEIQVDLLTGFSTSVDIVRTEAGDGGTEIIDVDENITSYQCNDTFHEIEYPPALTQGDYLQICIETQDNSVFEVGQVKDVRVSQNGTKVFDYVNSFVDSYWAASSCEALNTTASICKVKMQLLGEYFSDDNPTELIVEGMVKLDYLGRRILYDGGSSSTGRFQGTTTKRNLQKIGNAAFSLTAAVLSSESLEMEDSSELSDKGVNASPETSTGAFSSAYSKFHSSAMTCVLLITVVVMGVTV